MMKLLFFLLVLFSTIATAEPRVILVYGDSLSAAYGIDVADSWPRLLGQRLQQSGKAWSVANASISGETTAGGRSRFDAALKQFKPALVILALGANDGLRGIPVRSMRENLLAMTQAAKKAGARVLLVGMRLPPNYGPDYTREFAASFTELARQEKTTLLPFLLEPIAGERGAFLGDNFHPAAQAQARILDHVWTQLKPMLDHPS